MKGDSTCLIFTEKGRNNYDRIFRDKDKVATVDKFFVYLLGHAYYLFNTIDKSSVQIPNKLALRMIKGSE